MPRPKKETIEVTLSSNGQRDPEAVWGPPVELAAIDVPIQQRSQVWQDLYAEVILRLEKTPASRALAFPFKSEVLLKRAYAALRKRFVPGVILINLRKDPPTLYIRRGPNWGKDD
jgi:hypothetical protein